MFTNVRMAGALVLMAGQIFAPALPAQAEARRTTEQDRSATAKLVQGLMSDRRYAYRRGAVDDALSSELFDAYVDALDPEKRLYSETDLEALDAHRLKLDDALKTGKLQPVYDIAAVRDQAIQARCEVARSWAESDAVPTAAGASGERAQLLRLRSASDLGRVWRAQIASEAAQLGSTGMSGQALLARLSREYCNAPPDPEQHRNELLQVFLNTFAEVLDPGAEYMSPFVADTEPDESGNEKTAGLQHAVVEIRDAKVGVIALPTLYASPGNSIAVDVANLLSGFNNSGVDGLVLDLRHSAGGPLKEVIDLAGLFLGPVPVMQIRETGGRITVQKTDVRRIWDGPLAVLVDGNTASGTEMLVAALQDHGRAVVLGEPTRGVGSIQNSVDLDLAASGARRFGMVKLTIAEVFRLNGHPLDAVGIQPDLALPLEENPDDHPRAAAVASSPIGPARGYEPKPLAFDAASLGASAPDLSTSDAEDAAIGAALGKAASKAASIVVELSKSQPVAIPTITAANVSGQRYAEVLMTHVRSRWSQSKVDQGPQKCNAHVRQLPGGEVIDIRFDTRCPEDQNLRASIRAAIENASPLPYAGFEGQFTRDVILSFP